MRHFLTTMFTLSTLLAFSQTTISWDTLNTGTTKNINDIYFHSPDTGYIVGDDYLFKKTTDGGVTWVDLTTPSMGEKPGNNGKITGIDFHHGFSFNLPGNLDSALHLSWEKPYHGILRKMKVRAILAINLDFLLTMTLIYFVPTQAFQFYPKMEGVVILD